MFPDDQQLVKDFLAGNEQAFEKLLKKYLKPVYNFLYYFTNDRAATDDLAQITFIKAWKNISRYDHEKSFKTWLFTIAKNTTFDHLKKKKSIPFSTFVDDEGNSPLEEMSGTACLPDEILEKADIAQDLEKKLEKLSPAFRTVLILHYKEDFSLGEIAKILNQPYNTIKSRHARGLVKLKIILSKNL